MAGLLDAGRVLMPQNKAKTTQEQLDQLGLLSSPVPVLGDVMGLLSDTYRYATDPASRTMGNYGLTALGALPFIPAATVWHGSPHLFDKFDASKIGTGEGAQAYGHGLYFAENPEVARNYRPNDWKGGAYKHQGLSGADWQSQFENARDYGKASIWERIQLHWPKDKLEGWVKESIGDGFTAADLAYVKSLPKRLFAPPGGNLYKVDLPDAMIPKMLDWDKPVTKELGEKISAALGEPYIKGSLGQDMYRRAAIRLGGEQRGAKYLQSLGIPGIRYLDAGSRGPTGTGRWLIKFKDGKTETFSFKPNDDVLKSMGATAEPVGTHNYVVFPGNEGLLKILERQ